MRKNAAEVLFSGLRREVLGAMLLHPQQIWYLSQLARHLRAAPSHLHRELAALSDAGILSRRAEGRQTYFQANPICPFLPELTSLLRKLMGAPVVLQKALNSVRAKIQCAFIYGSIARGTEASNSDLDLMVVGEITMSDLLPSLRQAERDLGRPVNPTIYPPEELAIKFKGGHHFIRCVLKDPAKIFVVGSAHDLETIASGAASQAASNQQGRTRRSAHSGRRKA